MISSTPRVQDYDPREIAWQYNLIRGVRREYDYSLGTHEVLLSGSVGSGKSLPLSHLIVTHCLLYPGANFGIGRRVLPKLKATLCRKIQEHLFETGIDYKFNRSSGDFTMPNGSVITAFSWADGNFEKFGSYELSGMAIEEGSETKDPGAYEYALSRVGRLPHVPENIMLVATNPEAPSHWLAKRFLDEPHPLRHVFFSRTEDNKFLPRSYIEGLRSTLDPKLARRLLYGEWVEIDTERIYHAYESERNWLRQDDYIVDRRYPVRISWDFNIAKGKPLSAVLFQYIDGRFHFFDEVIVEGMNTESSCDELAGRGHLDYGTIYVVHGDASGKNGDTRSNRSDYDIIKKFLSNYRTATGHALNFRLDVPMANPPVRKRHNLVNAHCLNENGEIRLFIYKRCKVLDEGMRLTQLKDNAQYIEDDSKHFQHCTTALGYGVLSCLAGDGRQAPQGIPR